MSDYNLSIAPTFITLDATKKYIVYIGHPFDIDRTHSEFDPKETRIFVMHVDEFIEEIPVRERYKLFIDPFVEVLPEGKKDLDCFVLYYSNGAWDAFDILSVEEPRTVENIREASGLEDL